MIVAAVAAHQASEDAANRDVHCGPGIQIDLGQVIAVATIKLHVKHSADGAVEELQSADHFRLVEVIDLKLIVAVGAVHDEVGGAAAVDIDPAASTD